MAIFGSASVSTSKSETDNSSSGGENTNKNTRRLSDEQYNELSATLRRMQGGAETEDEQFSKKAAIKDTKGLVDSIFSDYRKTDLAQILEAQSGTGGYSGTGAQLLANDAFATATNKAASTVLGAIQSYSQIQDQKRQTSITGLSSVLSGLLQARESEEIESAFSSKSKSSTKATSGKVSVGI